MPTSLFSTRKSAVLTAYQQLVETPNPPVEPGNGIFCRYANPALTAAHVPVHWRYDLNPQTNPYFMERLGINCAFNPGAIEWKGKIVLVVRLEGMDRKSFFALAESDNGITGFTFREFPLLLPELDEPDTNTYDMRLVRHEDGYVYGIFCTERKDPKAPAGDTSSAVAQCALIRTRDLEQWERLPDIRTPSPQQRNIVLHPEFVNGKYAFYTRPSDGFMDVGTAGGIGWGLADSMEKAVITDETIIDRKVYHTIKESKNGMGPAPIKTPCGWLQLAHGVRNTAAGLRYVLYMFMTDLHEPNRVIHSPGGYFMAPEGEERVGDVSNVLFCNGWVAKDDGQVFIYYASSDTRIHVATSTVDQLVDYVRNTPSDAGRSHACVRQRAELIRRNQDFIR